MSNITFTTQITRPKLPREKVEAWLRANGFTMSDDSYWWKGHYYAFDDEWIDDQQGYMLSDLSHQMHKSALDIYNEIDAMEVKQ